MESVALPNSLKTISSGLFNACDALESVALPDSLETIEQYAFGYNANVQLYVAAGSKTQKLLESAQVPFVEGPLPPRENTQNAETPADQFVWQEVDGGVAITGLRRQTTIIGLGPRPRKLNRIVVPAKIDGRPVVAIGPEAFAQNRELKKITLPDSVRTIGDQAFAHSSLKDLTLPDGLQTIGDQAFAGCAFLESLTLPDSLRQIGDGALVGCVALSELSVSPQNANFQRVDGPS